MRVVRVLFLLALAQALDAVQVENTDTDCVAQALATADPSNSVGDAISNAIAQAFGKVVACNGNGDTGSTDKPSSLAISVAVAIASSETAGAECVAESDAVAEVVSDLVTQGVAGGLLENVDPVQQTLAEAWLVEEASSIANRIKEGTQSQDGTSGACSLAGLRKSLSTAKDVGAAMEDAISQILLAVTCGDNIEQVDPVAPPTGAGGTIAPGIVVPGVGSIVRPGIVGPGIISGIRPTPPTISTTTKPPVAVDTCRYDRVRRKFFGPCFPAKRKTRNCNQEFRKCENAGRSSKACHKDLERCSGARLKDVVGG